MTALTALLALALVMMLVPASYSYGNEVNARGCCDWYVPKGA